MARPEHISTGKGLVVWLLLFTWASFAAILVRVLVVGTFEARMTYDLATFLVLAIAATIVTPRFIGWIRS